jgi:putative toxin-antitoxin system antitoxin component (TIGR02293 family)
MKKNAGPAPRRVVHFRKRAGSIGLGASSTSELMKQIEQGFPFDTLLRLEENSGLSLSLLASIIGIPERTLVRRRAAGRIEPGESERLLRVSILFEKSVDLFKGDVTAAVDWLSSPKPALNNHPPLLYARTELGAREVEDLIGRVDGAVS